MSTVFLPFVAPYVGAWIETQEQLNIAKSKDVAPYVGAWIETPIMILFYLATASHPMWVRGLKRQKHASQQKKTKSHPMWVRGLKLITLADFNLTVASHPMWVRGLKQRRRYV